MKLDNALLAGMIMVIQLCVCVQPGDVQAQGRKLQVITSLFPLYDFAKNIGGDRIDVSLLLPPGVEPHDFEPRAGDMLRIGAADIFVYTGRFMEPWVADVLKGVARPPLTVVDASSGIALLKVAGSESHDEKIDPHIWLDFSNAQVMVDNILAVLIQKDPSDRDLFTRNARAYKVKLAALDGEYANALGRCRKRVFIQGGHRMFGYLARRYNLQYISAIGISPNAEPNTRTLVELSRKMKQYGLKYVYFEELVSPRIARTLAQETGAQLLELHGAHNLTRDEMERGVSFLSLMEHNLANLKIGLQCR